MRRGYNTSSGNGSLGSTSSSLIHRVKDGDSDAWRRLVKLYGPAVYVWCRQSGLNTHDAADVVQDTFLAVAGHLARFRRERPEDSFRGWLFTITRNKVRDHYRRLNESVQAQGGTAAEKMLAQIPELLSGDSQLQPTGGFIERRALELIQAEFEQRTWQAFWQTAVDGRGATEVAAELTMTKHAVRQAKYRVLRRLRQELDGLLD